MEDLLFESVRYSVHSDSFDVAQLADYSLHLRIHQSCLAIGVYDAENNECLALESYIYDPALNTTALIVNLHNIVQKHSFLNAAFWKNVHIISALPTFAYLPSGISDNEAGENALTLTSKFNKKKDRVYNHSTPFDANITFAVPIELEEWLKEMYSNSEITYNHSSESFMIEAIEKDNNAIHCYIDSNTLQVIKCKEDNSIEFANTFKYKTPQDLLYFVLFVIDELKLSAKDVPLYIWGEIKNDDESIKTLRQFISKVHLGTRPSDVRFAYQFDQEPEEYSAVDIIGNMKLNR
ncbi:MULTISPECIES: DUF3822 family protein [Flammeovirga]|uniref:DUF3822 family protein n=1 Tax=Flammeovirga agarivorans TaxID=2726742 RepID=A0A7X8SGW1_9BACT|nr:MULTISPECIES: DUF3822 family protein [Flammeovirga]NLR89991.1 DUF3822 family protein [Flammeovirga agarivorans]